MLIESLIKRAEGSFVTLGKDTYHFFSHIRGDNRHVAEVTDEDHIQTFLAIKEGYRIAKSAKKPAADAGAQGNSGAVKAATDPKAKTAATTGTGNAGAQGNSGSVDGDAAAGSAATAQ